MRRRQLLQAICLASAGVGSSSTVFARVRKEVIQSTQPTKDEDLKDYLNKIRNFDQHHDDDVIIEPSLYPVFESTLGKLKRLEKLVGHGNYNILSFPDAIRYAKNYSKVGEFNNAELSFMESVFYEDGKHYGFLGHKPLKEITDRVKKRDIIKVPYSGNYLYKDISLEVYEAIKKELGDKVVLTSGIRSVMKQFLLFLNKASKYEGNLSLASRSLAPPGYSFHGNGDFDVGQVGYGVHNFSERFTETEVYQRLAEMGYLQLRYPEDNRLGVRYEPWHIKIRV